MGYACARPESRLSAPSGTRLSRKLGKDQGQRPGGASASALAGRYIELLGGLVLIAVATGVL
jgi:hypothetical protein